LVKRKGTVVFCRVPDVVVYPASQEQVETLVQLAKEMNTVIIPFGGGAFRQDHGSQSRQSVRLSL
jgi:FAD/FMN-containing dehydrogenase